MSKLQQENLNKVPKKQWKKWPDLAQRVFNEVFEGLYLNQEMMLHPKSAMVSEKRWKTTAWNAAWTAADAATTALYDIANGHGYAKAEK